MLWTGYRGDYCGVVGAFIHDTDSVETGSRIE